MSYYVLQPLLAGVLVALGVLGAALALRAFTGGEVRRGLRRTGWALLPFGALAVGVSGLVARVAGAVSRWALQLVFSPVSWLGVVLLAIGAVLVLGTRGGGRRGRSDEAVAAPGPDRRRRAGAPGGSDPYALDPAKPGPAASGGRTGRTGSDAGSTGLLAELEEMGIFDEDDRR